MQQVWGVLTAEKEWIVVWQIVYLAEKFQPLDNKMVTSLGTKVNLADHKEQMI